MMSHKLITNQDPHKRSNNPSFEDPLTKKIMTELDVLPTKEDFQKIRDKDINLCLVGYGGAMVNMLYNMYQWAIELSEMRIFNNIVIFEKDTIDFSNLVRFAKPMILNHVSKFSTFESEMRQELSLIKKVSMIDVEKELSKKRKIISFVSWLDERAAHDLKNKKYTLIGAPDLETRTMLTDLDLDFYFMGHANHEVALKYQPEITSSLVNENYGSIDIPVLLINLQIATGAFIKQLASDNTPAKNEKLLSFDMQEYLERSEA
jgi:hypothetical protein